MLRLTVLIVKDREKTLVYDRDDEKNEKKSNFFKFNRVFLEYRPTDAINNHKGVDLYIKLLDIRTS